MSTSISGVGRSYIRSALSLLASQNLVHTYKHPSMVDPFGVANAYRLAHLEPRRHTGTSGRGMDFLEG
jgi:DNA-binding GntR family transcriptional regulator